MNTRQGSGCPLETAAPPGGASSAPRTSPTSGPVRARASSIPSGAGDGQPGARAPARSAPAATNVPHQAPRAGRSSGAGTQRQTSAVARQHARIRHRLRRPAHQPNRPAITPATSVARTSSSCFTSHRVTAPSRPGRGTQRNSRKPLETALPAAGGRRRASSRLRCSSRVVAGRSLAPLRRSSQSGDVSFTVATPDGIQASATSRASRRLHFFSSTGTSIAPPESDTGHRE